VIGLNDELFIIAEAGVNHNGDIETALEMISVAKNCGADAVKFQTFEADTLATKTAIQADYQKNNTGINESQHSMLKKLELKKEFHDLLKEKCREISIEFMSSPFDIESAQFLNNIGMNIFKVPSGEITNKPYLEVIADMNKPTILSTGMSTLEEISNAIDVFVGLNFDLRKLSLLHATSDYPANPLETNMLCINTLRESFGLRVGYSDHTESSKCAVIAASMGANIFEKHFTLDKSMEGPDHKASLEPTQLKEYISTIQDTFMILGDGVKKPGYSEAKNIEIVRKSIVARVDIKKGAVFTRDNLTTKRPGTGISPMQFDKVIGLKAKHNFCKDDLIEL
jgi:N,N'-diacetyllegionaminate synthase